MVLGGNSRIIFEFPDDLMRVFYMLEIVNNARNRVDIGGPLIIDLPEGAAGASPLEGSSPQATVGGSRITVTGPFASGVTPVQVGFQLPFSTSSTTIEQKWPVPIEQVTVASQKARRGLVRVAAVLVGWRRQGRGRDDVHPGQRARHAAGGTLRMQVSGLPVHSARTSLRGARRSRSRSPCLDSGWRCPVRPDRRAIAPAPDRTARCAARRAGADRGARPRTDARRPKDAARKPRLVAELEQIYGELDEASPVRLPRDSVHIDFERSDGRRRLASFRPPSRAFTNLVSDTHRLDPRPARP